MGESCQIKYSLAAQGCNPLRQTRFGSERNQHPKPITFHEGVSVPTPSHINNLLVFTNSQGIEARGTLLKLSRTTIVFEVYNPYSIVQLSEVLHELKIFRGEQPVYQGKAVVSNLMNTGLMLVVSATLVESWSDLAESIKRKRDLGKEVDNFLLDWQESQKLQPGYILAVGEFRSFLSALSSWLGQVELNKESELSSKMLLDKLYQPIAHQLNKILKTFEYEASKVASHELELYKIFAQQNLHPLIMTSPFAHRTFHKPLGYAGDYAMVNMIWQNEYEGPTIYAQLINKLQLHFDAAEAHRNRINVLTERLIQTCEKARALGRPAKILNIGCGPAIEIQNFIKTYPLLEFAEFDLLDFNPETLANTEKQINLALQYSKQKPKLDFILKSVHTLLKQTVSKKIHSENHQLYDFVYCAGLFDYLSDKACAQLLKIFHLWLLPGGVTLATNVHPNNSAFHWMEHLLEWHLIYRDENNMRKLTPHIGEQIVYSDKTGINVFLEIQKHE